jgi:cell wall-associated NlpC family hydrolase
MRSPGIGPAGAQPEQRGCGGLRPRGARAAASVVLVVIVSGCGSDPAFGPTSTRPAAATAPVASAPSPTKPAPTTTPGQRKAAPTTAPSRAKSQADSGTDLLHPTTAIVPARGCTILTPGMNGVKVKLVQRRLGLPASAWETMDDATIEAVQRFQRQAGLTADGVVGRRTWRAMGFREDFCFDRYQAAPALAATASARARREQMIAFATRFMGEEYVWGGAGPYGYGVDCSGLVLQSLYSAGLDPQPITVDKHVLPDYRTSRELYEHPRLAHLSRSAIRRGDLVFWRSNETGRVNHVAIYLGDGNVLEAIEPQVHIGRLGDRSTQTMMPEVVRPFGAASSTE